MNKKKILMLVMLVVGLFILSGCTVPTKDGKVVLITNETSFKYMFDNEGFFSALFVFPLTKSIDFIATNTKSVFLGVITVTIIVNVLVVLLTWKQSMAQQKMQEIQPEVIKIQKKYEGKTDQASKMRMGQEIQQLYAKYGVNPFGTMLSMFIQFPIIIAIYHAVMRSEQVANGTFLNLSLKTTPLSGITSGLYGYGIIFVVMALLQVASVMTPQILNEHKAKREAARQHKPYKKQPNPTQNIVYAMIGIVVFMGLTFPSGVTIYWAITSLIGIIKTLILHRILNGEI